MQSLTAIRRFGSEMSDRLGSPAVFAKVRFWGLVAPFAPDDDWRLTARAQYAELTGPLILADTAAREEAEKVAEHYGTTLAET